MTAKKRGYLKHRWKSKNGYLKCLRRACKVKVELPVHAPWDIDRPIICKHL